jgi:hypothetical protein
MEGRDGEKNWTGRRQQASEAKWARQSSARTRYSYASVFVRLLGRTEALSRRRPALRRGSMARLPALPPTAFSPFPPSLPTFLSPSSLQASVKGRPERTPSQLSNCLATSSAARTMSVGRTSTIAGATRVQALTPLFPSLPPSCHSLQPHRSVPATERAAEFCFGVV